jgi:translation initiation factor 1
LDTGGRKGKAVTLVSGLQMHPQGKLDLLQKFKKICGAGGTLKAGVLEVQGDHRNRLKAELEASGFKAKVL